MAPPWTVEEVLALAPDAGSAAAGRKLSAPSPWSDTGVADDPSAVWGLCAGSGGNPYQTVVDLTGPAYRCSCPSRKFPCKHALGLLLLWSAGGVGPAEAPPGWASTWLAGRAERATATAARVEPEPGKAQGPDPAASARRAAQRQARVAAGLAELDTWLADQVRVGLARLERVGYAHFESVAARMVDAQAPGLAGRLRALPGAVASGDGWAGRVLEELAALRLTVSGHARLDALPADLAACVRREVGYPVARDEVLAGPPLRDDWQVVGMRDAQEDRLSTRRVWLRGSGSGRMALVLSFAPSGQSLDASLVPGTVVDADLHLYPGARPLRALVGARHAEPRPLSPADLTGTTLTQAHGELAAAVAADPWTSAWPVVIEALTPVPADPVWVGVDETGSRVRLLGPPDGLWRLLALSGGRPARVVGELGPGGLRPLSTPLDDRLVLL